MKNFYSLFVVCATQLLFAQYPTLPNDYVYYNPLNSLNFNSVPQTAAGAPHNQTSVTRSGNQDTNTPGVGNVNKAINNYNFNSNTPGFMAYDNLGSKLNTSGTTISFWYKHTSLGSRTNLSDYKFFAIKRADNSDYEAVSLGIDDYSKKLVLYTYRRSSPTSYYYYSLPTVINLTEDDLKSWHHYMIEIEGANIKLYIDNQVVNQQNNGVTVLTMPTSPIYLGGMSANNGAAFSNTAGLFDSFLIYNRVLTADEREQIFNFRENNGKLQYDFNNTQMDLFGNTDAYMYGSGTNNLAEFGTSRKGKTNGAIWTYSQFNSMPFLRNYIAKTVSPIFANGFSFTAQFKMTAETNTTSQRYPIATIYNDSHAAAEPVYYKAAYLLAINKTTKTIEVHIDDADNVRHTFTTNFKVNLNEWAVVTTTFFGNTLKIYGNGNLYNTFDLSAITRRGFSTLDAIDLGSAIYMATSSSTGRDTMLGLFDDILFDTNELTDSEVAQLYTDLTGEPVPDMPTLAVTENTTSNALAIYPNPVTSTFRIANLKATSSVEILDNAGRMVQSKKIAPADEVSVQNLKPGMYLVRIQTGSEVVTKKLIKK